MKQVQHSHAALALLLVQLLVVLSVAGRYLYERQTRPRLWTRATQFDPNQPLRGRYLALQLLVDACALPRDQDHYQKGYKIFNGGEEPGSWKWNVSLDVENGHLAPTLQDHPRTPTDIEELTLRTDRPCNRVPMRPGVEFFIPDTAPGPFPLKPGQELWVEVTMPPTGPPRPIQLALSTGAGFQPLRFEKFQSKIAVRRTCLSTAEIVEAPAEAPAASSAHSAGNPPGSPPAPAAGSSSVASTHAKHPAP